jgi:hypothetical protein
MNSAGGLRVAAGPAIWLALFLALPCGGQLQQSQQPTSNGSIRPMRNPPPDVDQTLSTGSADPIFEERRMRQLNAAQHKAMVSDADKLVKLVAELNTDVMNSNPSSLTADQLRKVAEIEKLAHSVKDKMRMSVKGANVFMDTTPLPPLPHH